jgi:hypothetical protein
VTNCILCTPVSGLLTLLLSLYITVFVSSLEQLAAGERGRSGAGNKLSSVPTGFVRLQSMVGRVVLFDDELVAELTVTQFAPWLDMR